MTQYFAFALYFTLLSFNVNQPYILFQTQSRQEAAHLGSIVYVSKQTLFDYDRAICGFIR